MAVALVIGATVGLAACGLTPAARSSLSAGGTGGTINSAAQGSTTTGTTGTADGTSDGSGTADTTGAATGAGSATSSDGTATGGTSSAAGGTVTGGATAGGVSGATTPGSTAVTGASGSTGKTATTTTGKAGTTSKTSGTAKSTGATTKAGGTTTAAAPAAANCNTAGGNATGVTSSAINIGIHAPLTGTGTPFPNASFVGGSKLYWNDPSHEICGRKIGVDFQDDMYTPAGANAVCSQFAQNDFLAIGGAGTDQIQACATNPDIDSTGTPYLSAGVTENGLTSLSNYFAVSLTYRQQGNMLVKAAQAGNYATPAAASTGGQWAIVTANSANFNDATTGIEAALTAAGISYKEFRIDQSGNYQAAATAMGQTLALDGYKTVYTLTAPGWWVFQVGGYYKQMPTGGVTWVGPGVSFTRLCDRAAVLQHDHQRDQRPRVLPRRQPPASTGPRQPSRPPAVRTTSSGRCGESRNCSSRHCRRASVNGLTRQSFIQTLSTASLPGGTDPPVVYNGSHFGGTGAWLQVDRLHQVRGGPEPERHLGHRRLHLPDAMTTGTTAFLALNLQTEGINPFFNGIFDGCAYGLLALGIVLLYKSDRILNFAPQGGIRRGGSTYGVSVRHWLQGQLLFHPGRYPEDLVSDRHHLRCLCLGADRCAHAVTGRATALSATACHPRCRHHRSRAVPDRRRGLSFPQGRYAAPGRHGAQAGHAAERGPDPLAVSGPPCAPSCSWRWPSARWSSSDSPRLARRSSR